LFYFFKDNFDDYILYSFISHFISQDYLYSFDVLAYYLWNIDGDYCVLMIISCYTFENHLMC